VRVLPGDDDFTAAAVSALRRLSQQQKLQGRIEALFAARPQLLHVAALVSAALASGARTSVRAVAADAAVLGDPAQPDSLESRMTWQGRVRASFGLADLLRGLGPLSEEWYETLAAVGGGAESPAHQLADSARGLQAAATAQASASKEENATTGATASKGDEAGEYLLDDDLCSVPSLAAYNATLQAYFEAEASEGGRGPRAFQLERISEEPPVTLVHGFLSPQEADHLILQACGRFKRSTVATTHASDFDTHPIRTSSSVYFSYSETHVMSLVEERLALVSSMPRANMESLQIVRYLPGQKYDAHNDW